jgi:hypothetical protein
MESCKHCGGTKYTDALKKYNQGKSAWCMPRKGTELHAEVLSIMNAPKKPTRKLRKALVESVTNLGKADEKRIKEFTRTKPNISSEMEVEMNTLYMKENTGKISRNFIYQVISPTHVALIGYDSGNYSRGGKVKKYSTIKKFKWRLANDYDLRFIMIDDSMPNQSAERTDSDKYSEIMIKA